MDKIKKYKSKGQTCFVGFAICPRCNKEYKLYTMDKSLFDNPKHCFECFMTTEEQKKNERCN